jgi:HEAT repeat protein
VELLHSFLGRDVELDLAIMPGLVDIQRRFPWRVHFDLLAPLRKRLEAKDERVRAASAVALGELRDRTAVHALVARLGDPDPIVARSAQWSLCQISGRSDLRTGDEWKRWLQAEQQWWKEQGPALVQRLREDDRVGLADVLRTLALHPMAYGPAGEALIDALPNLAPERQATVCATLGQLSVSAAVPALIDLLFDGMPAARQAAWQALRAITGRDLPIEPRLWEEYAFG